MRRSSWVVGGLIILLAAALFYARTAARPNLTDEEQIHTLLANGQSAIERKDLRDALSCVSRSYSDSAGLKFDALRLQGARAFQEEGRFDISLENTSVKVRDDKAEVETEVALDLTSVGNRSEVFAGHISLLLRKEESKRWGLIPARAWKVTRINGLTAELGE